MADPGLRRWRLKLVISVSENEALVAHAWLLAELELKSLNCAKALECGHAWEACPTTRL